MIKAATADLFCFLCLLVICLLGFAQAGFLAFSLESPSFQTLGYSFLSVLNAVRGGALNFGELSQSNATIAPIFLVAFYFIIVLVLGNVFYAVLNNSFISLIKGDSASKTRGGQVHIFPFSRGLSYLVKNILHKIEFKLVKIKHGKQAAMQLQRKFDEASLESESAGTSDEVVSSNNSNPLVLAEMKAIGNKVNAILQYHQEKKKKLDSIDNLLSALENMCADLKTHS